MHLGLGLENTVVAVTGGGGQIAESIIDGFLEAGCYVAALEIDRSKLDKHRPAASNKTDRNERLLWLWADTTDEKTVEEAWQAARDRFGAWPTVCVCAAALDLSFIPHHRSIATMPTEQFRRTIEVNVTGTFITAKTWLKNLTPKRADECNGSSQFGQASGSDENVSLIIVGSEAGALGVAGNADYAASKSAVQQGLVLSLAPEAASVHPRARVNAICPGAVDTPSFRSECANDPSGMIQWGEAEATTASRRPTRAEDVARLCLVLASDKWSASTNAQAIRVDAGKSGRVYWNKAGDALW